jgi:hypothetical protein
MTTSSPVAGTVPPDQLVAVCHNPLPAIQVLLAPRVSDGAQAGAATRIDMSSA